MATESFCQPWEGPGYVTLGCDASCHTPGFWESAQQSEDLGACLESLELLHSMQGFPGGLREFINLTSTE